GSSVDLPAPVLFVHFVRKQDEGTYQLKVKTERGEEIAAQSIYIIVTVHDSIEDVQDSHLEEERREVENQTEPIGFHKHHTSNIVLLHEHTLAKRINESEWRSICFTNRPITLNENVYVRILNYLQTGTALLSVD
ncbi:uncharacterized protein LOC133188060, partial [Saccostrea echinata]|uniref:uncharacterized protein LOC133188060 n=1 Tax=Saccostrea echinata TaxID=191078 RepID=UPI002A809504